MLVGSTTARTRGMLTRVAPWIAMTNAVSAAAICARAEVPASSMSDARSAVREIIAGCCAPAILVGTFSRDRLGAVRGDRYLCTRHGATSAQVPGRARTAPTLPADREKSRYPQDQINRRVSRSEVFVTGVGEPNMQHAVGRRQSVPQELCVLSEFTRGPAAPLAAAGDYCLYSGSHPGPLLERTPPSAVSRPPELAAHGILVGGHANRLGSFSRLAALVR